MGRLQRRGLFTILALLSFGCAAPQVILFKPEPQDSAALEALKTDPHSIGVYRSEVPFQPFTEIGLITTRTNVCDFNMIYRHLRQEASLHGAEAIIGVRTKGESHYETHTETKCTQVQDCYTDGNCVPRDVCHDEQITELVSTYLTEGSMIKRTQ